MKIEEVIERLERIKYSTLVSSTDEMALEIGIKSLKKQISIEPIYSGYDDNGYGEFIPYEALCPICGYAFEFGKFNDEDNHHCICGQKMKWL